MMAQDGHDEGSGLREAVGRKGSFAQTMKAVAWSFFGVRKGSDYEKDVNQLNPVHVVIAGVIAVLIFIGVLVAVVHWVVGGSAHAG
jgi:cytochrome b561